MTVAKQVAIQFELDAQLRLERGTGANRRLRRTGKVPAVMYGVGKESVAISLSLNELGKQLEKEAFYSHLLTINVEGQPEKAVLKALQRHPSKNVVIHADFQRVSETEKLTMHVPLHFTNEANCIGLKQGGGVLSHQMVEVEVRCFPKDLPEFVEVDLTNLELGQSIHLSELILPTGVELVALYHGAEYDAPVASVQHPRGIATEEGTEQTPTESTTGAAAS